MIHCVIQCHAILLHYGHKRKQKTKWQNLTKKVHFPWKCPVDTVVSKTDQTPRLLFLRWIYVCAFSNIPNIQIQFNIVNVRHTVWSSFCGHHAKSAQQLSTIIRALWLVLPRMVEHLMKPMMNGHTYRRGKPICSRQDTSRFLGYCSALFGCKFPSSSSLTSLESTGGVWGNTECSGVRSGVCSAIEVGGPAPCRRGLCMGRGGAWMW